MKLSEQRGFTLIEMLVALLIAGIFFSIFVGVVLATFETLRSGDERTVAQANARVGLNYLANDIKQAVEIAPLRLEANRDWATGGFPIFDDDLDEWPIYRRSVDSDPDGYIDLDYEDDEYDQFRDDDIPYDVRPLAPNRISLLFPSSTFYPNTEYWSGPTAFDIDDIGGPNPTSAVTRVTYEHQLVRPLHDEIYTDEFSGREKDFDLLVNRSGAASIADASEFVIIRSFEMLNPTREDRWVGRTSEPGRPDGLGAVSDQLQVDAPLTRQPVADHVINLRFRYWHIAGNTMMEIRYDPNTDNIGGTGIDTNDGYYRYFDIFGKEICVWYNHEAGQMVPLMPPNPDSDDLETIPVNSFVINGGDDQDDEFERGLLLFEGWRFVNAVSITIKTTNNRTLNIYRSSINLEITDADDDHPDYGMGFIDFGLDQANQDTLNTLNQSDPFYQAADNLRVSTVPGYGFDFVEPNMNPNYNPSAFTTLQTFVVPPAMAERAESAIRELTHGKWYIQEY